MAEYLVQDSSLIAIANAIRTKTSKTETLTFPQMVDEILNLAGLNFVIIGSASQPSAPSENTLWVETSTEVPTFSIRSSIERPTDPVEGMVWVVNGQTSSGSFDILADENSLIVYPQKAYQYINGEWTARPIKIYKNGVWTDLFAAILNITYPEGALCECTDGVITYTAPDRTGIWELIVPNPGTWITSGTEGEWEIIPVETLIDTNGESQNIELKYFEATIKVTYPVGTCTCVCGSTSYSHSGGGTATFTVNKAGTWTVRATYNSVSANSTVSIATNGETKSVTLVYKLDLYNAGNQCTSVTGGWVAKGDASLKTNMMDAWSSWQTSGFTTNKTLSFTGFSKICVTFGYYESTTRIKIVDSTDIHATAKATKYANAKTTTMVLGTVTSGKVQICMNSNQGFTVTKVWLES